MDKLMAFLMKYIGGFFKWWRESTGLPTVKYTKRTVSYSMLALIVLVSVLMVIFLPGGLLF